MVQNYKIIATFAYKRKTNVRNCRFKQNSAGANKTSAGTNGNEGGRKTIIRKPAHS